MQRVLLISQTKNGSSHIWKWLESSDSLTCYFLSVVPVEQIHTFLSDTPVDIILFDVSDNSDRTLDIFHQFYKKIEQFPIIVITSKENESVGIESIHRGCEDYLVAGACDKSLLHRSIRYSIERKKGAADRCELEEQLRQSQKMEAMGRLAGGIAHDFKNILGAITGYADLMKLKEGLPETHLRFVDKISQSASRAASLTDQLLSFARKGSYKLEPMSVHSVIEQIATILSHTIDPRVVIKRQLRASADSILGNANQLENALLNLALNARDAMPEGGELTIETKNEELDDDDFETERYHLQRGSYITIQVKDTGIGMSRETRERIFEPFFTTKDKGKGSGFGLSSVYGCIKQHKGVIMVKSKPGKGSVFTIMLPLNSDEIGSIAADNQDIAISGKGKILFIDDEEMIREIATELLGSLGYEVVSVPGAQQGVEYYREHFHEIAVVILDMVMPEMNGFECFKELKKINPQIIVIISTGNCNLDERDEILQEGVQTIIDKPFKISQISKALADALAGRTIKQLTASGESS